MRINKCVAVIYYYSWLPFAFTEEENAFFFIEKLRQLTHVVGTLSHKGIARRALPASGGKDVDGGNRKVNKGE